MNYVPFEATVVNMCVCTASLLLIRGYCHRIRSDWTGGLWIAWLSIETLKQFPAESS